MDIRLRYSIHSRQMIPGSKCSEGLVAKFSQVFEMTFSKTTLEIKSKYRFEPCLVSSTHNYVRLQNVYIRVSVFSVFRKIVHWKR